jgi:LacI family transcriptional regulator
MNEPEPLPGAVRELTERLRAAVQSGQWPAGARLPSTRQLAQQHQTSKKTVARALACLERDRLIERSPRRRAVVRGRGVRPGRGSQVVALLTPRDQALARTEPNWFGQILMAADEVLLDAGFHPLRMPVAAVPDRSDPRLPAQIDHLRQIHPAGVILTGGSPEAEHLTQLLDEREIPWVSLRPLNSRTPYNYVTLDFFDGCRAVGELFVRGGRRSVLYLGPAHTYGQMQMLAGFEYGVIRAGGRHEDVIHWPTDRLEEPAGYACMLDYCRAHKWPEAVLAAGDFLALGVIRACRELGADVPGRIGVVGATGYRMSAFTDPPLTVIQQPQQQLGHQLANLLLTCIQEGRHRIMGLHLTSEVVVRDSFTASPEVLAWINADSDLTPVIDGQIHEAASR